MKKHAGEKPFDLRVEDNTPLIPSNGEEAVVFLGGGKMGKNTNQGDDEERRNENEG